MLYENGGPYIVSDAVPKRRPNGVYFLALSQKIVSPIPVLIGSLSMEP